MRRAAAATALFTLLLIAGCGGGGGDETSGPAGSGKGKQSGRTETTGAKGAKPSGEGGRGGEPAKKRAATGPNLSDAATIRIVIDRALASGEPLLACELYVTPAYVTKAYGGRDGCRRAQGPKAVADGVKVSEVKVEGGSATAVAVPNGGASDGEDLDVSLVLEGGAWKVDSIESDAPVGP